MNDHNSNLEFRKLKSLKYLYEVNENGTIFRNVKSKKQLRIKLDMHHSDTGYYTTFVHLGGRGPDARIVRVPIHRAVAEESIISTEIPTTTTGETYVMSLVVNR